MYWGSCVARPASGSGTAAIQDAIELRDRKGAAAGDDQASCSEPPCPTRRVERECARSMAPGARPRPGAAVGGRGTRARLVASRACMGQGQSDAPRSARAFSCARCGAQVLVCSRCDRGQRYCGRRCSLVARREGMRAAGRRYQASRAGRFAHARRAHRYRRRHREQEIVTHHGSQGAAGARHSAGRCAGARGCRSCRRRRCPTVALPPMWRCVCP
jgi:hypothetical protein